MRKGAFSEVFVIVLLIVVLAVVIALWLLWASKGKILGEKLEDLFIFR
ncbi:MAG: hypothetical protein J7K22_03050 [Nanoarchaeota archaeon]|nr:hypothetical protein [Nanoarchaeota archaeon]